MVRERPFVVSFLDGFDWRTLSDGGGGGGSSNTDWMTDGGDTRRTWFCTSKQDAAARTTARKAGRHRLERPVDVAGRFERGGDAAAAIDSAERFGIDSDGPAAVEGATALSMANSAVGDGMTSIESSAGLAIVLRSIPRGGGVGGRDMVQWIGVLICGMIIVVKCGILDGANEKNDGERVGIPTRSGDHRPLPF